MSDTPTDDAQGLATLTWAQGSVTMQPRGAMLRDLVVRDADGRTMRPLHRAPWVGTPEAARFGGLMEGLSGEWPCVPFGLRPDPPVAGWPEPQGWDDPFAHGYAAHHDWTLSVTAQGLEARIDMPADHPVRRLRRRVQPVADGIGIDLWVEVRRDCRLPIGLHPVFALPDTPERMQLSVEGAECVFAHPETAPDDPSPVRPGAMSRSLASIQGIAGAALDFSHLPRDEHSETRLLVTGGTGRVTLADRETGQVSALTYDAAQFPFVMLWVSNRGRALAPWSRRHLALGVEPVRAAFDLGTGVSTQPNPLSRSGADTAFDLSARDGFHTRYEITASVPLRGAVD